MMTAANTSIAVLGTGSWGTALAIALARNEQKVWFWGRNKQQIQHLANTRVNTPYLPDVIIPQQVEITDNLATAVAQVNDILITVPSNAFRSTLQAIKPYLRSSSRIVWATKGLDTETGKLLHEVAQEIVGTQIPLAVLSGPSFAKEVAAGLPTAITVASNDENFANDLIKRFHSTTFRVYTSDDMIGVQIGGTVKNILAIASGIADGLGFGANARCALLTRGLAEMMRLGMALGGKATTFMGLAGLGDLILTGTDNQSRNRRFGLAIGQGLSAAEAERSIGQVIEGKLNAAEVYHVAQKMGIDMPIIEQVYNILYHRVAPHAAVSALMSREPKAE